MKKTVFYRVLLLAVSILLAWNAFLLIPSAESPDAPLLDWSITPNGLTLSDGTRTFSRYTLPTDAKWEPILSYYVFDAGDTELHIKGTESYQSARIASPARDSEIIFLQATYIEAGIYVTEDGKTALDHFFETRENGSYRLARGAYYTAPIDTETALSLGQEFSEITETDVTRLALLERFSLVVYDKSGAIQWKLGDLYCFENGAVGYVDYKMLNNSHFDAEGNFSYRSGTAPVILLPSNIADTLQASAEQIEYCEPDYEYEAPASPFINFLPLFWTICIIIGYILPLILLLLGLFLPRSKKRGNPKRWYVIAVLAAIWIVLATALILILL